MSMYSLHGLCRQTSRNKRAEKEVKEALKSEQRAEEGRKSKGTNPVDLHVTPPSMLVIAASTGRGSSVVLPSAGRAEVQGLPAGASAHLALQASRA